ncbi:hypothetical protein TorRG33x02_174990, partial [Trema orientale]
MFRRKSTISARPDPSPHYVGLGRPVTYCRGPSWALVLGPQARLMWAWASPLHIVGAGLGLSHRPTSPAQHDPHLYR